MVDADQFKSSGIEVKSAHFVEDQSDISKCSPRSQRMNITVLEEKEPAMKPRDSMKSKSSSTSSSVPKKNMFSDKKKKQKRRNVFDLTGVDGDDSRS